MKSLFQKVLKIFNSSKEESHTEVCNYELTSPVKDLQATNTYDSNSDNSNDENNKYTRTISVDLSSWKPRPKAPIVKKEIYNNDDIWRIGTTIEFRRKHLNLTQKQLSELLGYKSTSFVSSLELGTREKLSHEQLEVIAKCLNTTTEKLLKKEFYD